MKNKRCEWCDSQFQTLINYQIYCSTGCRESATKEKIAQNYMVRRTQKRLGKTRLCKSCGGRLSVYNDETICAACEVVPAEVLKALREMKGIANEDI